MSEHAETIACGVCEKPANTAGYCLPHYKRLLRHGDPLGGAPMRDRRSLSERFASGYTTSPSGCWEWNGAFDPSGYGVMRHYGPVRAHRYSFAQANNVDDFGEIDHACRNPDHLREVTRAENSQNQATIRQSRSGYRGVAWHEYSKSWHVVVNRGNRQYSGGYFKDVHAAGLAAIALRNKLYTHNEEDRKLAT